MAAYSLTDWPVINTLIDAHRRGVALRVILDLNQQHSFDQLREIIYWETHHGAPSCLPTSDRVV